MGDLLLSTQPANGPLASKAGQSQPAVPMGARNMLGLLCMHIRLQPPDLGFFPSYPKTQPNMAVSRALQVRAAWDHKPPRPLPSLHNSF